MGKHLSDLANAIVKTGEIIKKAPNECQEDNISKALINASKLLLGLEIDPLQDIDPDVSTQLGIAVSSSQDPFWIDPELIKMVEEIEAVISSRKGIVRDGFNVHYFEKGEYSDKKAEYVVVQAANFTTATVLPSAIVPPSAPSPPSATVSPSATTTFDVDLQGVLHDIVVEHCVPQNQTEEVTINLVRAKKEKKKKVAEVQGMVRRSGRDRQSPNRYH